MEGKDVQLRILVERIAPGSKAAECSYKNFVKDRRHTPSGKCQRCGDDDGRVSAFGGSGKARRGCQREVT